MCWETIDSFNTSEARKVDLIMEYLRSHAAHISWRTIYRDYETGPGINLQVPVYDEEEALKIYDSLDVDFIVGFILDDDDHYVMRSVISIIHRMLKHPSITARQIVGLGNALYALERLPKITEGVKCIFSVNYEAGNEAFKEFVYVNFEISDKIFKISRGGSICDAIVGSDSYSLPGWLVEAGGYSDKAAELYDLEATVFEYLILGARIEVDDESQIDYNKS
ncbi:hypothetical protein P9761_28490 [Brevibacillus centrosporus]|uniref:hypothetical protein n=1 Tax=Brevibacillus centrosporus TaxID=54910 RepID=UPI002E1E4863|nr:hypothetical protein [Brevibacillus centrosporus]